MKVYWTDTAKTHLYGILDYISIHSEVYAKRVIDQLTRRSEQIGFGRFLKARIELSIILRLIVLKCLQ